jgi:hypothetical protein
MPFEKGNQLAASHHSFNAALKRAIDKRNLSRKEKMDILEEIADKMLDRALESKADATEIADRLDGKAKQSVDANVTGELTITKIERAIVDSANTDT